MDNLRRFVIVFTAVIFLTLAVCGFILAKNFNETAKTKTVDLNVNANVYDPNKPQDFELGKFNENVLFVIGDKDSNPSELTILMNVNTETNELSFMYFPRQFKYATLADRSVGNMGMICRKKGISKAADIIASQYEISVDNYIYMECELFAEFIDLFVKSENPNNITTSDGQLILDATNAIEYELFVDLKYKSGKYNIDLNRNTKYFTGKEAVQLIQFYRTQNNEYPSDMLKYYDGTDGKRIVAAQAFLDAFISQKLLKTGSKTFADEFQAKLTPLLSKCETNLTEHNLKQIGTMLTRIIPDDICYYIINGNDQYLDQHYIVYNDTVTDLKSNSVLDGATTFRDKFYVN